MESPSGSFTTILAPDSSRIRVILSPPLPMIEPAKSLGMITIMDTRPPKRPLGCIPRAAMNSSKIPTMQEL
uniref:Uncharacterized protein n=1 Tax=Romanomermis culicivorax TaxID=13658 RepID=A0A915HPW2_ROMCU